MSAGKITLTCLPEVKIDNSILDSFTIKVIAGRNTMIEERFQVSLNTRPSEIPKFIWDWMVRKVVKVEIK
ncbi:MAG: hypothetical protein WC469_06010 [Candidatus Omnitrophota bacterium]|jgi:hypothetical protein